MLRRLRRFYWTRIRRWDSEICQDCGGPVGLVWWCHDDLLWEKVTGNPKPAGSRESAAGVFCINCFDREAKEVCPWIEWAPLNLRHLQSPEESQRSADERAAALAVIDRCPSCGVDCSCFQHGADDCLDPFHDRPCNLEQVGEPDA